MVPHCMTMAEVQCRRHRQGKAILPVMHREDMKQRWAVTDSRSAFTHDTRSLRFQFIRRLFRRDLRRDGLRIGMHAQEIVAADVANSESVREGANAHSPPQCIITWHETLAMIDIDIAEVLGAMQQSQ